MILFLVGLLVGGTMGIFVAALAAAARLGDEHLEAPHPEGLTASDTRRRIDEIRRREPAPGDQQGAAHRGVRWKDR
jgi:hypothetical protein